MTTTPNVLILGRGKVAHGLSAALEGEPVRMRSARRPTRVDLDWAEAVVLAVSDGAIAEVARAIAPHVNARSLPVLHCAGTRRWDEAAAADIRGAMHPMVSFASARRPPSLQGTSFVISGHPDARRVARAIAYACGAHAVIADAHGPRYHAAAAMVANGAAALATPAVPLLRSLGMSRKDARHVIAGLLRTVAENIERVGVPDALTGPVARGDAETVRAHREALSDAPEALAVYDGVAPAILACAEAVGLPKTRADSVRDAIAGRLTRPRRRERS